MEAYAGRKAMEIKARKEVEKGAKTNLFKIMEEHSRDRLTSGIWERALKQGDDLATRLIDRAVKALGVRLSLADRGLTFGSTAAGGVCVEFTHPRRGIEPFGLLRHPGLTLTVADPDGLVAALRPGA